MAAAAAAGTAFGDISVFLPSDHAASSGSRLGDATLTLYRPGSSVEILLGRMHGAGFGPLIIRRRSSGDSYTGQQPTQLSQPTAQESGAQHDAAPPQQQQQHSSERGSAPSHAQHASSSSSSSNSMASGNQNLSPWEKRQLTTQIVNCRSWQQMATLVHLHNEQLDHLHISAALVKLAKLLPGPGVNPDPQLPALFTHLCSRIPEHMRLFDDRQASNMLWALAVAMPTLTAPAKKKGKQGTAAAAAAAAGAAAAAVASARRQAQQLAQRLEQFWGSASPQALSNALWALATLQLQPSDQWLHGFITSSRQLLPSFRPQELSSMLWALAVMRVWPGRAWLDACCTTCSASLSKYGAQALANTLWALVKLQAPLPPGFIGQLCKACMGMLGDSRAAASCSSGGSGATSDGTHAAARAGAGAQCVAAETQQQQRRPSGAGRRQERFDSRHVGMVLWSLAALQRQQRRPASSTYSPQGRAQSAAPCSSRASTGHGSGTQNDCSGSKSPSPAASAACTTAAGGSAAGHAPAGKARTAAAAEATVAADQAAVWALVTALVQYAEPQLPHLSSRVLASMSWSLGSLHYTPSAAWQQQLMAGVQSKAAMLSAIGLCQVFWALARWSARPSQEWFEEVTSAVQRRGLPCTMTVRQATMTLVACARMQSRPSPGFTHWLLGAVLQQTVPAKCGVHCAAQLAWAFAELQLWPGAAWVAALRRLLAGHGAGMLPPALVAQLLGGLSRLPLRVAGGGIAKSGIVAGPGGSQGASAGTLAEAVAKAADSAALLRHELASPPADTSGGHQRAVLQSKSQLSSASGAGSSSSGAEGMDAERDSLKEGNEPGRRRRLPFLYLPARLVAGLMSHAAHAAVAADTGHLADAAWAACKLGHPPPARWLASLAAYAAGPHSRLLGARSALHLLATLAASPMPVLLGVRPVVWAPAPAPGLAAPAGATAGAAPSSTPSFQAPLGSMAAAAPATVEAVVARLAQRVLAGASTLDVHTDVPLLVALMAGRLRVATPVRSNLQRGPLRDTTGQITSKRVAPNKAALFAVVDGAPGNSLDVSGTAVMANVATAVQAGLPQLPPLQLAAVVSTAAAAGFVPSPHWGAAVEQAAQAALGTAPTFGGISSPDRVCLLGSQLFTGHQPSQPWLHAWCGAVEAGAKALTPSQLLAALRLAGAAAAPSGGSTSNPQLPCSFLAAVEAAAVASCKQPLAMLTAATTKIAGTHAHMEAEPSPHSLAALSNVAEALGASGVPAAACLEAWGAVKLAVLAGHLHMAGHAVSPDLETMSDLAVMTQLAAAMSPRSAQHATPAATSRPLQRLWQLRRRPAGRDRKPAGTLRSLGGGTATDVLQPVPDVLPLPVLVALSEVAHLPARRCGAAAGRAVTMLLRIVQSAKPSAVLDGICAAAAVFEAGAVGPRHPQARLEGTAGNASGEAWPASVPPLSLHALERNGRENALEHNGKPQSVPGEGMQSQSKVQELQQRRRHWQQLAQKRARDPVAPFYAALSICPGGGSQGTSGKPASVLASPGRTLCLLLEMLASWGMAPSGPWLSALVSEACLRSAAAAAMVVPSAAAAAIASSTSAGSARLSFARTAAALRSSTHAQMEASAEAGPASLLLLGSQACSLLRSLALMQAEVASDSIERLLAMLTPSVLRQCSVKQVAEVAWALGAVQYRPPAAWWDAYESVLLNPVQPGAAAPASAGAASAAAFTAPSLLSVMPGKLVCEIAWACAALRLPPSPALLTGLASAAARQLPSLDPSSLSNLIWSLYVLDDSGPGPAWMDLWLSEAAAKMAAFEAQDLALAISGLAAAKYRPRHEWLARFMAQALARLPQCRGVQLVRIITSLAELGCHPDSAWLQHFANRARTPEVAAEFNEAAYGQLVWAFDKLSAGALSLTAFLPPGLAARVALMDRSADIGTAAAAKALHSMGTGKPRGVRVSGGRSKGTGRVQRTKLRV